MPVAAGVGIATAVSGMYAAHKQSSSADKAARLSTDAANRGADLQAQSGREALDFQKAQAAKDDARQEVTRRANYDQWVMMQKRHNTLGQMLGYGAQDIPAYVPLDGQQGAQPGQPQPAGQNDPRIADVFNRVTQGLAPTSQNLDVVIKALNDAGVKASRATHAGGVASDDFVNFDGGGGFDLIQNVGSPNAKWQMLAPNAGPTLGQMAAPTGYQRTTPTTAIGQGVQLPTTPYRPRTLYDYAGAN